MFFICHASAALPHYDVAMPLLTPYVRLRVIAAALPPLPVAAFCLPLTIADAAAADTPVYATPLRIRC